jgi:thymidylate synthase (FAD)
MKLLSNQGSFKLLATWPSEETNKNSQTILEKAGRTCYQSEKHEITPESAQKFCTNLLKRTHYSIFEHGWRGYILTPTQPIQYLTGIITETFWPISKFFFISKRHNGSILVSANLETWRKSLSKNLENYFPEIVRDLHNFAPVLFSNSTVDNSIRHQLFGHLTTITIEPITSISQLQSDDEKLIHIAHTTQYNNHSRGFTHELVRHRLPVFSQESTRYVDEKDFEVIIPPHKPTNETLSIYDESNMSIDEVLENKSSFALEVHRLEHFYKALRNSNWRPEDARQILPNGIAAQIVMSCNLKERRYIYFRRTSTFAHWEIRRTMIEELNHFNTQFPELFNMFMFTDLKANDGIPGYCEFTKPSEFFCNE